MATAPTDESVQLFALLQDGRWHPYPHIKAQIAAKVPPGKALRAYELRMAAERRVRNDPDYNTLWLDEDKIEFGKFDVAQKTVSSWKERGLQSWGKGPRCIIRIKPGFTSYMLASPAVPPEGDEFAPGAYPPGSEPPEGVERPVNPPRRPQDGSGVPLPTPGPSGGSEGALGGLEVPFDERVGQDVDAELAGLRVEPGAALPTREGVAAGAVSAEGSTVVQGPAEVGSVVSSPSVTNAVPVSDLAACPQCGLPVSHWEIHMEWHARLEAQNLAVEQILSVKVFQDSLDAFQAGMERWFAGQFAQLEAKIQGRKGGPSRWRDGPQRHQQR